MNYNTCGRTYYLDPIFDALMGKRSANVEHLPMYTDIFESDKEYRVNVDLPGFEKEDISVDYKDGYLSITVKSKEAKAAEGFKSVRHERFYGESTRQFYFGDLDEKAIHATYENGVLALVLPKLLPVEEKPYKIEIQ